MTHGDRSWHAYRLGGIAIGSDRPLVPLEPYRAHAVEVSVQVGGAAEDLPTQPTEVQVARGFLAEAERTVRATWHGDAGVDLHCDGAAVALRPGCDERRREPWRLSARGASDVALELLLGPGLLLALFAARRVAVHASAARVGERTLLFAGDSGRGKSTLAAGFEGDALADDLALVDADTVELTPRFPQRKWTASRQAGVLERSGRVTLIEIQGDRALRVPRLEVLSKARAARCWLAHAVPARLFSSSWSRLLFSWAADAAEASDGFLLHLPWHSGEVGEHTTATVDFLRRAFSKTPSCGL